MSTYPAGSVAATAALRAGIAGLAAADPRDLSSHERSELLAELTALQSSLDAQSLRLLATFDAVDDASADGAASTSAWMRWNLNLTPAQARQRVRTARQLGDLPAMADAHRAGAISTAHVDVVVNAMARTQERRDTIAEAEQTFADAARSLDPTSLARAVKHWTHVVDPLDALAQEREHRAARWLSASRTFDGAVAINGVLDPESGACVMTALEALSTEGHRAARTAPRESRERTTPGQRRADALVELSRRFLDSGTAPEIMGVRPHLSLLVDHDSLAAARDEVGRQPADLQGVGPVSLEATRRLACDATRTVFSVDELGQPLSYGRTMRVVPPGLRKYLNVRDRGCVFPGCDRPPAWCQAHHLVHWVRGGETSAENCALVCSHHHHVLHEGGFTTTGSPEDGSLTFHRPDGSVIVDRRSRGRPEPRPG